MKKTILVLAFLCTLFNCQAKIIYVDDSTPNDNDGSNWANAYKDLQIALGDAGSNPDVDAVYIAQGTYKPVDPLAPQDRATSFKLINNVTVKGGFSGYGTPDPNERDVLLYETILSGDIGVPDEPNDNCFHVFNNSGIDNTAVLSGVTITGGNADDAIHPNNFGGGMYNQGDPMLINCTFRNNSASGDGGGMYNQGNDLTLTNCTFIRNSASRGGGIYSDQELRNVISCSFQGNTALAGYGGGIYLQASNNSLVQCMFSGNNARFGGGIYSVNSTYLFNCTLSGNTATEGGGIYVSGQDSVNVYNSILWGNSDGGGLDEWAQISSTNRQVEYSCIQGWTGSWVGNGNIGTDPRFVQMPDIGGDSLWGTDDDNYGDLQLQPGSPCIDAADKEVAINPSIQDVKPIPSTDLAGDPRFVDDPVTDPDMGSGTSPIVDMGAYEYQVISCGFSEDFENDLGEWTKTSMWHLTENCRATDLGHTQPKSLFFGDNGGGCTYDSGQPSVGTVTSPVISLVKIPAPIQLTFRYFLETEGDPANYDKAWVRVSVNGNPFELVAHNDPGMGVVTLSDPSDGWREASIDLSEAVGGNVQIRFGFNTVDEYANDFEGFYVDDVRICREQTDSCTMREGFESGDFNTLTWFNDSQQPWNIWNDPQQAYAGAFFADISGLGDNKTSTLELNAYCTSGDMTFYREVSSEQDADYLEFYIDSVMQDSWSGELDWAQASYVITEGWHTFAWKYVKNETGSEYGDFVMIDEVVIPTECGWKPIYVDRNADGNNDGTSWADAYTELQSALADASYGREVWVANGTYRPDYDPGADNHTQDRNLTFKIMNGVAVYGGFAGEDSALFPGGETHRSQRNSNAQVTILSGDLNQNDMPEDFSNHGDNSYHVVTAFYAYDTIIDGFSISGGNIEGDVSGGGGMLIDHGKPTISNCIFRYNRGFSYGGGGVYNYESDNSTFSRCTFVNNRAVEGAGFFNRSSSALLTNCTIADNAGVKGAGLFNDGNSEITLTNCVFIDNSATSEDGGGMYSENGSPTLTNCIFNGNSANHSCGGIYSSSGDGDDHLTLTNCILWGNSDQSGQDESSQIYLSNPLIANYNCVQGWTGDLSPEGVGNFDADPLFIDADGGNLRFLSGSPCIDAGDNTAVPSGVITDLDNKPRFADDPNVTDTGNGTSPIIDIGAYEGYAVRGRVYVAANATGANDGTSWADAYTDLHTAIANTFYGDIWVVAETYKPTSDFGLSRGDRGKHFRMKNDLAIYGGFEGTETELFQRDIKNNKTFLSGDIGTSSDNSDNCRHIFYHPSEINLNDTAILDGFYIVNANADGIDPHARGGGMYNNNCSPTIANCVFGNNFANDDGGGIYNTENSSPILTSCRFGGNYATYGAGIFNDNSSNITATGCIFTSNSSSESGGGMHNISCDPTLTNCMFSGNSAKNGGGMYNAGGDPMLTNCTFSGNSTSGIIGGAGLLNSEGDLTMRNCILWGNIASSGGDEIVLEGSSTVDIEHSNIQGGYAGYGNIGIDPLFVDPNGTDSIVGTKDDNLRLMSSSPCIDAGDNAAVPGGITTDLNGFNRFIDDICMTDTGNGTPPVVDMGAYEYLRSDINSNGTVGLEDFAQFGSHWSDVGCGDCEGADLTCDGDVDITDLWELAEYWLAGSNFQ